MIIIHGENDITVAFVSIVPYTCAEIHEVENSGAFQQSRNEQHRSVASRIVSRG